MLNGFRRGFPIQNRIHLSDPKKLRSEIGFLGYIVSVIWEALWFSLFRDWDTAQHSICEFNEFKIKLLTRRIIVIFYTEILPGKVILWCFFSSERSEKIHNSTFQVKILVQNIIHSNEMEKIKISHLLFHRIWSNKLFSQKKIFRTVITVKFTFVIRIFSITGQFE